MKVLCHGIPFNNGFTPLKRYAGPHDIRSIGAHEPEGYAFNYRYDPVSESFCDIIDRIGREWMPDLFLCWYPANIPPPRGIEDSPIPTAAMVSDWNLFYPVLKVNLARFDYVLCDKKGVEALRSDLVSPRYLLPLQAQDSAIHKPHAVEKDLDAVYIGSLVHSMRPERSRYLQRLAALSDDYRIFVGSGYDGDDYARLLSRARIVFNHSVRSELNLRVFETMACGSVAFLEESNAEVRDWFQDGVDIVLYNEQNFEERLRDCLDSPGKAEAIAARGLENAASFAGENRLDMLIDGLAVQAPGERRFKALSQDDQEFETLLLYGYQWLAPYQELEKTLLSRFASAHGKDPRAATAIGRFFANPHVSSTEGKDIRGRCAAALRAACTLAPGSAPYAMNAAWGCRWAGLPDEEEAYLRRALNAESMEGGRLLLGDYQDPFWIGWLRALAEGRAKQNMLRAEAHRRLAHIQAFRGQLDAAERSLAESQALDPGNSSDAPLLADIRWRTGRIEEAAEILTAILPNQPFDLEGRARLHMMLSELGRRAEADELERQSVRIAKAYEAPEQEADSCAS